MTLWLAVVALSPPAFAADEPSEVDATSAAEAREADMFGEQAADESVVEERLADRLEQTADPLAIGGQLYLRYEASRTEAFGFQEDDVSAPGLLDVYLDARPSDRVRAYARGRLTHYAVDDRTGTSLDQLWLKFDVARTVFATVGRQHIKWGVGRLWNPTDFLMDVRDPLAPFDERLGRSFLKLHLPWEALGWNLYAVGEVVNDDGNERGGGAGRAELVVGPAEVAVTGYKREDSPWRVGADVSAGLGPIDVRGEAATVGDPADTWEVRAVGAIEAPFNYSDEDSATVGVEFLSNPTPEPSSPLYRGEGAVGGYLVLFAPGSWNDTTIITNYIRNLTDDDWIARLDWQVQVLTYLRVNVYGQRIQVPDAELTRTEGGVGFTLSL